MRYGTIRNLVARKYQQVTQNGISYFVNEAGEVVATENSKKNLLVMYVYSNRHMVWSHHDTVAVAIAKDFKLISNFTTRTADVIVMNGLCGSCTTIERSSNMLMEVTSSCDVRFGTDKNVCKAPYIARKGLVARPNKIGTMGHMLSSTVISLDVGLEIDMSAVETPKSRYNNYDSCCFDDPNNLAYGILSYKKLSRKAKKKSRVKKIQRNDYTVYDYLRNNYSWHWDTGYRTAGSAETRNRIVSTQEGTNYHRAAIVSVRTN